MKIFFLKGIYNEKKQKYYNIGEEVIVPIIENSKNESDLVSTFKRTLKKYPMTSAVLVRNHGMYVWGKDWQSAKSQWVHFHYHNSVWLLKIILKFIILLFLFMLHSL